MKKIITLMLITTKLLFADYVQMQTLLDTQSAIATAINSFIEARGLAPASIAILKSTGYLPSDFNAVNPVDGDAISFTIASNEIRINSNLESSKIGVDDLDYYTNTFYNREMARLSKDEGGILVSYYMLLNKSVENFKVSSSVPWSNYKGSSDPTNYASVINGSFWFSNTYNDDSYQLYYRSSGVWGTLEKGNKNFDSIIGILANQQMIPLLKSSWQTSTVTVSTLQKAISCAIVGTTYNPLQDRCEAYTSNACDSGLIYRTTTGYCDVGDSSACTWNGGTWDNTLKTCQKGSSYQATSNFSNYTHILDYTNSSNIFGRWNINLPSYVDSYAVQSIFFEDGSGGVFFTQTYYGRWDGENGQYYAKGVYFDFPVFFAQTMITKISIKYSTTTYTCPLGGTLSGTTCSNIEYFAPSCSGGLVHDGQGRCGKPTSASSCSGKTMSVSPFSSTPYYGNNGVCYSDMGMYCKTAPIAQQFANGCFNNSQTCNDASYTLRTDTDVCEKYSFSCTSPKNRYGLIESPTNKDTTDLYNRIANKDDTLNSVASSILSGNVNVNDNNGAMCVNLQYTTFTQPTTSPDYNVGGETKSGF